MKKTPLPNQEQTSDEIAAQLEADDERDVRWEETERLLIEYMERKARPPSKELQEKQERLRKKLASVTFMPSHDKSIQ